MKKILTLIIFIFLIFALNITIFAEENDYYSQSIDEILDETNEETKSLLEKLGLNEFTAEELSRISFKDITDLLLGIFKGSLAEPIKTLIRLTGIIFLFSVCCCYITNDNIKLLFESITIIYISLLIFSDLMNCIAKSSTALESVSILMKTLVPIIAAIAAFSGSPGLAVSYNAITVYAAEIITAICSDFLTPVLMMFAVFSVCLSFAPNAKGENILSAIKKCFNMLLGFCSAIFAGIAGIKNLLSSGADKVSVKGVQFLLGSSVPVVGGALSEGLSSVIAAISLMKSTVGVVGIIIITVTILPVVCELILWLLALSLASYICGLFSHTKAENVLNSLKFVVSTLQSVILFCAYIFIVSTGMVILMGSK